ncbi:MAG TPA: hypothetical protein VKF38_01795 [Anaerolineaceae bacterium]|nr:hypothetical protein [Anaerolineaceae bacterium]
MLDNGSFRVREEYNKTLLKEAQDYRRIRLAEEWNRANKNSTDKSVGPSRVDQRSRLFRPVVRLVGIILITLGL